MISLNNDMNYSIITEYHQDQRQFSPTVTKSRTLNKSPQHQKDSIYNSKLEAKVKELKMLIKKNKPLIEQLKGQRKFLRKIYEKQKQKIECTKIDLIKNQYEQEIEQLRQQRHKLQDVISVIHDQSSSKARDFVQAKEQIRLNSMELQLALQQIEKQNFMLNEILVKKMEAIQLKKIQVNEIKQEIKSKSNVERKYRDVMNQIQLLEKI